MLLFSQNLPIKTMRKLFTQKKINMQISFLLFMCGEPKSKHALIQKGSEITRTPDTRQLKKGEV